MRKDTLLREVKKISQDYLENPLIVEKDLTVREAELKTLREALGKKYLKSNPEYLLEEYRAGVLILEGADAFSKNMEELEEVTKDLLALKAYFAPHAAKLPTLIGGITKAIAEMQRAEAEITQRASGVIGSIKAQMHYESVEKFDNLLTELSFGDVANSAANFDRYSGVVNSVTPGGPGANLMGWIPGGTHTNTARHVARHAAGAIGKSKATAAAMVGNAGATQNAASMTAMKAGAGAKGVSMQAMKAGADIKGAAASGSIWKTLGSLLSSSGMAYLVSAGIGLAAIYGLVKFLKSRTKVLNRIINFTMALASILKGLNRQVRIYDSETDKTQLTKNVMTVNLGELVRTAATRNKGANWFKNIKVEELNMLMNIELFTKDLYELTIEEFVKIFGDNKLATAFSGSQIQDLGQARVALRGLETIDPAAAPVVAPTGAPAPTPTPTPTPPTAGLSPLVATLTPRPNLENGAPDARVLIGTILEDAVAKAVITQPAAQMYVNYIPALDAAMTVPGTRKDIDAFKLNIARIPGLENAVADYLLSGCKNHTLVKFKAKLARVDGVFPNDFLHGAHAFRMFDDLLGKMGVRAGAAGGALKMAFAPLMTAAGYTDAAMLDAFFGGPAQTDLLESKLAEEFKSHQLLKASFKKIIKA